jgi:hypothetical protein
MPKLAATVVPERRPDRLENAVAQGGVGEPVLDPPPFLPLGDETGLPQFRKVLGDGGGSEPDDHRHLADAERAAAKRRQQAEAARVRDCFVDLNEACQGRHRHFVNSRNSVRTHSETGK